VRPETIEEYETALYKEQDRVQRVRDLLADEEERRETAESKLAALVDGLRGLRDRWRRTPVLVMTEAGEATGKTLARSADELDALLAAHGFQPDTPDAPQPATDASQGASGAEGG